MDRRAAAAKCWWRLRSTRRSSVAGENWPAEIEKAVAVWRSGGNADYPRSSDYAHLNGGDPAWAVHVLKGGQPWYHWADADDTWSTIRSHCSWPAHQRPAGGLDLGQQRRLAEQGRLRRREHRREPRLLDPRHVGDQQPPVRDPAQPVGLVRGDTQHACRHLVDARKLGQRDTKCCRAVASSRSRSTRSASTTWDSAARPRTERAKLVASGRDRKRPETDGFAVSAGLRSTAGPPPRRARRWPSARAAHVGAGGP